MQLPFQFQSAMANQHNRHILTSNKQKKSQNQISAANFYHGSKPNLQVAHNSMSFIDFE